jgi:quercetin dioxygenase-like cupin family protein
MTNTPLPTPPGQPLVTKPHEGRTGDVLVGPPGQQARISVKLTEADGAGFGMVEYHAPAGMAPPPVLHRATRETHSIYVLEGRLGMEFEDQTIEAPAGTFISLPPSTWFRWWVEGDASCRYLAMFSPAGFESFFSDLADAVAPVIDASTGVPDPQRVAAAIHDVRAQYGDEEMTAVHPA